MNFTEILKELIEENRIKLLLEVFNKIGELPDNLKQEGNTFYFTNDGIDYYVEFKEFNENYKLSRTITDDNKKIIDKIPNGKYIVEFGVVINNKFISNIDLKNSKSIRVLNYIISIINYFIKENDVNLISYFAESKRLNIYSNIFEKLFSNNFNQLDNGNNGMSNIIYVKRNFL